MESSDLNETLVVHEIMRRYDELDKTQRQQAQAANSAGVAPSVLIPKDVLLRQVVRMYAKEREEILRFMCEHRDTQLI